MVTWNLDKTAIDAGYKFSKKGIAQDEKAAVLPAGCNKVGSFNHAFHKCDFPNKDETKFKCERKIKAESDACYKYVIELTSNKEGVPAPAPLDPWIKNK